MPALTWVQHQPELFSYLQQRMKRHELLNTEPLQFKAELWQCIHSLNTLPSLSKLPRFLSSHKSNIFRAYLHCSERTVPSPEPFTHLAGRSLFWCYTLIFARTYVVNCARVEQRTQQIQVCAVTATPTCWVARRKKTNVSIVSFTLNASRQNLRSRNVFTYLKCDEDACCKVSTW